VYCKHVCNHLFLVYAGTTFLRIICIYIYTYIEGGLVYGLSKSESRVLRWRLHERTGCTVLGAHTEAVTALCFEAPAPTLTTAVVTSSTAAASATGVATNKRGSGRGATAAAAATAMNDSAVQTAAAAAAASGPVIISAALDGTVRAWQTLGATCTEKWKACANSSSNSSSNSTSNSSNGDVDAAAGTATAARTATGRE
jgi:hypothetical protein